MGGSANVDWTKNLHSADRTSPAGDRRYHYANNHQRAQDAEIQEAVERDIPNANVVQSNPFDHGTVTQDNRQDEPSHMNGTDHTSRNTNSTKMKTISLSVREEACSHQASKHMEMRMMMTVSQT